MAVRTWSTGWLSLARILALIALVIVVLIVLVPGIPAWAELLAVALLAIAILLG